MAAANASSIDPSKWGPAFWTTLHTMSLQADANSDSVPAFHAFMASLPQFLPCAKCKSHLQELLQSVPPPQANLFEWSVELHNRVSASIGKAKMSSAAAKEQLLSQSCTTSCEVEAKKGPNMAIMALMTPLLFALVYLVLRRLEQVK